VSLYCTKMITMCNTDMGLIELMVTSMSITCFCVACGWQNSDVWLSPSILSRADDSKTSSISNKKLLKIDTLTSSQSSIHIYWYLSWKWQTITWFELMSECITTNNTPPHLLPYLVNLIYTTLPMYHDYKGPRSLTLLWVVCPYVVIIWDVGFQDSVKCSKTFWLFGLFHLW
jgi:hypothetical protein